MVPSDNRPLSLYIPLPSRSSTKRPNLIVGVSARNGLVEIDDQGKGGGREARAKLVERGADLEGARLPDDIGRLIKAASAIIASYTVQADIFR
jgi:hypothetical protein